MVTSAPKSQKTLEILSANKAGSIRHETLNGRRFIVAPLSLIRPGVLNGSKGPLMYPADELAKSPHDWNGMPILLDHPYKEGQPVSGRSPDIFAKQGLGYVYHARFQNKLAAEGWFDVELCKRNAPKVLANLEAGKPLELSTGLFTSNVPAQGTHNGKGYKYEARNYKPDHLAVFTNKIGACSLADGCGVLVNQQTGEIAIRNEDGTIWNDKGCDCDNCKAKRRKKSRMERKIGLRAKRSMKDAAIISDEDVLRQNVSNAKWYPWKGSRAKSRGAKAVSSRGSGCGTGAGGFKPGNKCASGGGSGKKPSVKKSSKSSSGVEKRPKVVGLSAAIKKQKVKVKDSYDMLFRDGEGNTGTSKYLVLSTGKTIGIHRTSKGYSYTVGGVGPDKKFKTAGEALSSSLKYKPPKAKKTRRPPNQKNSNHWQQQGPPAAKRRPVKRVRNESSTYQASALLNSLIQHDILLIHKRKGQKPSAKLDMSPEKACQIIRDGYANGEPLTEAQKGMFGALCGKSKKKRTNNSLTDNAASVLSFEDRRMQLRRALKNRFGFRCHIVDVYDNYLVYMRDDPGPMEYDGPRLFQVNYIASKAGVKLSDEVPVEVQRITSYEPVTNEEQEVTNEQIEELAEMFGIDDEELIENAKEHFGLLDNAADGEEDDEDIEVDEEDESDDDEEFTSNEDDDELAWLENFAVLMGTNDPQLVERAKQIALNAKKGGGKGGDGGCGTGAGGFKPGNKCAVGSGGGGKGKAGSGGAKKVSKISDLPKPGTPFTFKGTTYVELTGSARLNKKIPRYVIKGGQKIRGGKTLPMRVDRADNQFAIDRGSRVLRKMD